MNVENGACLNLLLPGCDWCFVHPPASQYDSSIPSATGAVKTTLEEMRQVPSAYWIDTKAKIHGNSTDTLEGILRDAASKATPPLVAVIHCVNTENECS